MKQIVKRAELDALALTLAFVIRSECSGYRVVKCDASGGERNIFPDGMICPVATKRECYIFLKGIEYGIRKWVR